MVVGYWIVAGLLAVFYLYSGGIKILRSQEQLAPMMAWAGTAIPMSGVRAIGTVEIAGALGLVLPPLTGIAPSLAVWAAGGLALVQVLATAFHLSRGERKDLWLNGVLVLWALGTLFLATRW